MLRTLYKRVCGVWHYIDVGPGLSQLERKEDLKPSNCDRFLSPAYSTSTRYIVESVEFNASTKLWETYAFGRTCAYAIQQRELSPSSEELIRYS